MASSKSSPTSSLPNSTSPAHSTPASTQTDQKQFVKYPHPHDVLCGRGGASNHHIGNIVYRKVVNHNKKWYVMCRKHHKVLLGKSIVEAIALQDPPGRFLAKDPRTGKWYNIGYTFAVKKTSQALREGALGVRLQNERLMDRGRDTMSKEGGAKCVSEESFRSSKNSKAPKSIDPVTPWEDLPPTYLDQVITLKLAALLRKAPPKKAIRQTPREKESEEKYLEAEKISTWRKSKKRKWKVTGKETQRKEENTTNKEKEEFVKGGEILCD